VVLNGVVICENQYIFIDSLCVLFGTEFVQWKWRGDFWYNYLDRLSLIQHFKAWVSEKVITRKLILTNFVYRVVQEKRLHQHRDCTVAMDRRKYLILWENWSFIRTEDFGRVFRSYFAPHSHFLKYAGKCLSVGQIWILHCYRIKGTFESEVYM
jgi:hypothetical protein